MKKIIIMLSLGSVVSCSDSFKEYQNGNRFHITRNNGKLVTNATIYAVCDSLTNTEYLVPYSGGIIKSERKSCRE